MTPKFTWVPPEEAGKLVAITNWHDDIIIACEYRVYRMWKDHNDETTVELVEVTEVPA